MADERAQNTVGAQRDCDAAPPAEDGTLDLDAFQAFVQSRSAVLLSLGEACRRECRTADAAPLRIWQRPFLNAVMAESSHLEELLDAFGARRNEQWFVFREYMAAMKLFSEAGYKLLHLSHSVRRYQLCTSSEQFHEDTLTVAQYVCARLVCLLVEARDYGCSALALAAPETTVELADFSEALPSGILASTRRVRRVGSAREAAVQVATTFLRRAAGGDILRLQKLSPTDNYQELVPDTVSEQLVSRIENTFHNMQTHYDTHIVDTEMEQVDTRLPILRGHVSVIYHLLEVAVLFLHFFERHMGQAGEGQDLVKTCPIRSDELLGHALDYSVRYANLYLGDAREICRGILARYSETAEIHVRVPRYRGFHVRPSTLIAKIVGHYGAEVTMVLMGQSYDASKPLELFRANEQINAIKRRRLAKKLDRVSLRRLDTIEDVRTEVRRVVLEMAAANEIVIYQHPLPIEELEAHEGENLGQYVADQISRLLARGIIDIDAEFRVKLVGDKRVLADIRCLAENGYGEDRFGNNIPLPPRLSYLHRDE